LYLALFSLARKFFNGFDATLTVSRQMAH